jgi:hypothetical protein
METEDDDELRLVRASGSLLSELVTSLPKLLWKPSYARLQRRVHRRYHAHDLDTIVQLVYCALFLDNLLLT